MPLMPSPQLTLDPKTCIPFPCCCVAASEFLGLFFCLVLVHLYCSPLCPFLSFFFLFLNHDIPLPDLRHIVLRMFLLLPDIKPTHYSMVRFPPLFLQTMIPSSCGFNTYESKSGFSIFSSSLVLALSFLSCGLKFPHFSFLLY
jgi:hypothetical protein